MNSIVAAKAQTVCAKEAHPLFMVAERSWKTRDAPANRRLWVEPWQSFRR